jgi:putative tryptophan/tyrosine transport system substrate-binding protein
MRRNTVGIIMILVLGCLVVLRAAEAQQSVKVYRIGFLGLGSAADMVFSIEPLRQGLRELGYIEGRNLTLEYRGAEGRLEHLADLAVELVRLPVDLIVTYAVGVRAAKHATTTLPIVVLSVGGDLVEAGIVESLARPGGNITGSFYSGPELQAKRLELLKEAFPSVTRVAVLLHAANLSRVELEALESTARALGVTLHLVKVHGPDDFDSALTAIVHGQAEALVVADHALLNMHADRIGDLAVEKRLPTIGARRPYLMAHSVDLPILWRRAAIFIDKILHGARPGDLPIERAAQFELTIDLKIAQELGLTIPESLLLRADKVFPVSGVPLPESIRIVPPDRRVTPELAAFSGKWFGTWEGYITNEQLLVVEAIDPPHAQVILAWGNGTVGAGTAHSRRLLSNWQRLRGKFVEGTLQMSFPNGITEIYRLQPDGTLAATNTWRGGEVSRATMTRAQP